MRVIKLTSAALRQWRANVPHLVDNDGKIVRPLSTFEDTAIANLIRETKSRKKGLEREIQVRPEGSPTTLTVKMVTEYQRRGRTDADHLVTVSIDGHQYKTGREILAAKLFAAYGECQIRGPNGVVLKFVRDATLKRPTYEESLRIAPHPDHCPCKEWGEPHPGTHYYTCPQNRIAPPEHQAVRAPTEAELGQLPEVAFASLARPSATGVVHSRVDNPTVMAEITPAPKDCNNGCLEWVLPAGKVLEDGQHNPMCVHYDKWKIKTVQARRFWLIDITTGKPVRMASDQEAGEAEVIQRRTGAAVIQIDDVPYGVVSEEELEAEGRRPPIVERPPAPARTLLDTSELVAHQSGIR